MAKHKTKTIIFDKNLEYIKYSIELHKFPIEFCNNVLNFMNKCHESLAVRNDLDEM